ncbi:hypothetical protein F5148DRAFT_1278899 [Russula earlei]|uniref:Uncharacterized protein n=1 Tax=Russula earlei TaxID=71964 RepID=A0ACC0UPG1_9AGAM|nr:hypothetical protein F5148DRAFT_1278899 [Russula earlei]
MSTTNTHEPVVEHSHGVSTQRPVTALSEPPVAHMMPMMMSVESVNRAARAERLDEDDVYTKSFMHTLLKQMGTYLIQDTDSDHMMPVVMSPESANRMARWGEAGRRDRDDGIRVTDRVMPVVSGMMMSVESANRTARWGEAERLDRDDSAPHLNLGISAGAVASGKRE